MLNCHDATLLMSQAQDGQLTLAERVQLRLHVSMCRGCTNFERQLPRLRIAAQTFVQKTDDD